MANTIKVKYSNTPDAIPTLSDGEIAINQADKKLFYRNSEGVVLSKILEESNGNTAYRAFSFFIS